MLRSPSWFVVRTRPSHPLAHSKREWVDWRDCRRTRARLGTWPLVKACAGWELKRQPVRSVICVYRPFADAQNQRRGPRVWVVREERLRRWAEVAPSYGAPWTEGTALVEGAVFRGADDCRGSVPEHRGQWAALSGTRSPFPVCSRGLDARRRGHARITGTRSSPLRRRQHRPHPASAPHGQGQISTALFVPAVGIRHHTSSLWAPGPPLDVIQFFAHTETIKH